MQSSHLVNSAYSSTPLRRHNFCPWTQSCSLSPGLLQFPSLWYIYLFFFLSVWVFYWFKQTSCYIKSKSIKTNSNKLKGPALRNLWSIPCSAYKTTSLNLSFLNLPSIALTAWRNCTGYRYIIASSSKSPSWHIELSRHPIHPISNTSFSAVIHLVFAHLPSFNYTSSQIIPHPRRLLVCCLERLTFPNKRSTIPGALQTSPEDPPLQDTNMKLIKTQGAPDAMQMAHYKLTIIITIITIK